MAEEKPEDRDSQGSQNGLFSFFEDSFGCMRDPSWDLLLDPPECTEADWDREVDSRGFLREDDVSGVDVYFVLDVPGSTVDQKSSSLCSMLVDFLLTSLAPVGEPGSRPTSSMRSWIGVHLRHLSSPQKDLPVLPLCTVERYLSHFPVEELAEFKSQHCMQLERHDHKEGKKVLQLGMAEQAVLQDPSLSASEKESDVCNHLLMRALLVLLQLVMSQKRKPQMGEALSLLSVTLIRLLNDSSAWSAKGVAKGAESLLKVNEAPGEQILCSHRLS